MRLSDVRPVHHLAPNEEYVRADLLDPDAIADAIRGSEAVVHLGGMTSDAPWPSRAATNIDGTYNVLRAAATSGVRRVVFASSHHVLGYHRRDSSILRNDPEPRPDSLYAVTKVAGEALGRMFSDKYGLSVISVRLGSVVPHPTEDRHSTTWLSRDDLVALVDACLQADVAYAVVNGISSNTGSPLDLTAGSAIGYRPRDDASVELAGVHFEDRPNGLIGGNFTEMDSALIGRTINRARRPLTRRKTCRRIS